MKFNDGKGVLAQIDSDITPEKIKGYTEFTKQDFLEMLEFLGKAPKEPPVIWYPGNFLLSLDDKYFESMVRSDITIMCGVDVADKIKERMKKLNIEL